MNSPSNPGAVSSASGSELGSPGGVGGGSAHHPSTITTVVGALDGAGGLVGLEPGEIGAEDTEAALAAQLGIRVLDDDDDDDDVVGRGLEEQLGVRSVHDDDDDDDVASAMGVRSGIGRRSRDGAIITTSAAGRISLAMTSNSPGVTVVSNLAAEVGVSLPSLTSLAPSTMLASPSTDAASTTHEDEVGGLFDSIAEQPPVVKEIHDDSSSRTSNDGVDGGLIVARSAGTLVDTTTTVSTMSSSAALSDKTASSTISDDATQTRGPGVIAIVETTSTTTTTLINRTLQQQQHQLQQTTSTASPSSASPLNHQPCFECPFCKCSLASAQALNSHIETHINRTSTSSSSSSNAPELAEDDNDDDDDDAPRPKKAKVILGCGENKWRL